MKAHVGLDAGAPAIPLSRRRKAFAKRKRSDFSGSPQIALDIGKCKTGVLFGQRDTFSFPDREFDSFQLMQPQEDSSNFTLKQHIIFPADRKAALAAEAAGPQGFVAWERNGLRKKFTP